MLDRSAELRHTGVVKIPTPVATATTDVTGATAEGRTRREVVRLLTESGSITAGQIGDRLGLSAAGVRRHLDALIAVGDAEAAPPAPRQHVGRGRPAKRFRLTAAGRAKLEHAYDDLAVAALRQLREIGGKDAIRAFARRRIDTILADVAPAGSGEQADVAATADRVAAALTEAGYVASTDRVPGHRQGMQICQHHCPVSHVAEEFPELCEAEREAMAAVLGTHVQRLATIANGDNACTTHIPLISADH
ncbi:transcriptional regulator [Mycolicibacillus parakoreensis]|nr:transcriptional regulator [Mycolicibacillus parakoreensis]